MTDSETQNRTDVNVYKRLLGYLRPYPQQVFIAYTTMIITTGLNLIVPIVIRDAIDDGLAAGNFQALLISAVIILGIAIGRGIAGFGQRYYGDWLSHRAGYDLRNHFFNSVQSQPFSFHDRTHTGDMMSRATSDISETERFVGIGMADLLATIFLIIGVVIAMLLASPRLALIAILPIPLLTFATVRFGGIIRPMFKSIQEQMGVLSTTMQESMTGIQVVKAFARETYELEKFDKENDDWFERRFHVIKTWANNWPLFSFLVALSIFLLMWFGGPMVIAGTVTVGTLFALISYVLMLNGPVQRLGFLVNLAATAGASASRVFDIMDTPSEIQDKEDALELPHIEGEVRFEKVDFSYPSGKKVLEGVTFHAKPGDKIALIGPTGSGKSTITSLIMRFYDVQNGKILIDNVDVRDWMIKSLRSHIGIVLQDPFLFSQTIGENIAYGAPGATYEEIVEAAISAHADKFIQELADGYDTRVGERGVTLSGGQKQRVAIARALLTDPRILILDDSTSSVDTETEHIIQEALEVLMEGRTTFIIAQRLLTLKSADCILVIDDGRIVERGSHENLLRQGGLYKEIYDLQLKDQEEFVALQNRMQQS